MPHEIGDVIDGTLCAYMGYFLKLPCISCTCDNCGEDKYKERLLDLNRDKLSDKRKQFMIKIWITITERKEGKVQSFLDRKFERCCYVDLINLLTNHVNSMAEHNLMASWNYYQHNLARRNIIQGDITMVHKIIYVPTRTKCKDCTGDTSRLLSCLQWHIIYVHNAMVTSLMKLSIYQRILNMMPTWSKFSQIGQNKSSKIMAL